MQEFMWIRAASWNTRTVSLRPQMPSCAAAAPGGLANPLRPTCWPPTIVRDEIPRRWDEYPALVVELKWNRTAQTAMCQIREKKYPVSIEKYTGDILLVALNYDKDTKAHQCLIEKLEK